MRVFECVTAVLLGVAMFGSAVVWRELSTMWASAPKWNEATASQGRARGLEGCYRPSQCGPICLYATCRHYGIRVSLEEVCRMCEFDGRPVSMSQLVEAAKKLDLKPTPLNASISQLENMSGPAIIDYPTGHFSVFLGWNGDHVGIFDPPRPLGAVYKEKLKAQWGGHVLVLERRR